jgi:hypothetical protein
MSVTLDVKYVDSSGAAYVSAIALYVTRRFGLYDTSSLSIVTASLILIDIVGPLPCWLVYINYITGY